MGVGWEDSSGVNIAKLGLMRKGVSGGPAPHQASLCPAQVSLFRCTLLSSLLLICSIHETEQNSYCQQIITERHLDYLQDLVSASHGGPTSSSPAR